MTLRQSVDTFIMIASLLCTAPAQAVPTFERVLDKPCRALALDQEPYWAALGDDVATVGDKRGTHEEKLPDALRGSGQSLGIFFGRDYRIRIAGTASTAKGEEVRYYRSLPGGLKVALDELGPLGKSGTPALFALLGTADPEIVCRAGVSCLIKRISGWSKASAPQGLERVGLSLGTGWATAGTTFYTLGKDWKAVSAAGTWQRADDAFVRGDSACVVERASSKLHHFDGKQWRASPSPVTGPRSVWGTEDSFWIAGDGGAATLEGDRFQKASSVARVAQVLGRSSKDVWLCSAEGVFRSRTP
jgi:hypothetical protein